MPDAVAEIVTVPGATAMTSPVWATLATPASDVVQVYTGAASCGMVAVLNCSVCPASTVPVFGEMLMAWSGVSDSVAGPVGEIALRGGSVQEKVRATIVTATDANIRDECIGSP